MSLFLPKTLGHYTALQLCLKSVLFLPKRTITLTIPTVYCTFIVLALGIFTTEGEENKNNPIYMGWRGTEYWTLCKHITC